jgi:hypothetical protein
MVPQRDTDLPKQLADLVERYVSLVHDRITVNVVKAIRAVVFGFVLGIVGATALVLVIIIMVRLLTIAFFGRVWLAFFLTGVIFIGAGAVLMSKRHEPSTES